MSLRICLSALLALVASGCEGVEAPVDPPGSATSSSRTPTTSRGLAPAAAERIVVREVAWPDLASVEEAVLARFGALDQRAIARSGVPVLAPRDARVYASTKVVATPQWFTIAMKDASYAAELEARRHHDAARPEATEGLFPPAEPGLSLFVQGTRVAHRRPGVPSITGRDEVRGRPAWITQNESIWSATWEEGGVSYVTELECSVPTDARCQSADLLLELTESLAFVGGAGPVASTSDRHLPEDGR